jgi:hypothetical protein
VIIEGREDPSYVVEFNDHSMRYAGGLEQEMHLVIKSCKCLEYFLSSLKASFLQQLFSIIMTMG